MIKEVLCPHCDQPTVIDLPDESAAVGEVHASLRYTNRETCGQCDRSFSFKCR
ncbi:MAG: hypothetical protein PPP58_03525 [Natronomonas sp.]